MVKNSRRPASMLPQSTSLAPSLRWAKFCAGPTLARPGPAPLIVAMTAVTLVIRSAPVAATARLASRSTMM